jgi:hypothetical protein
MKTKLTILFACLSAALFAQPVNDTVIFNELGHYYFTPSSTYYSSYTPLFDRLGRSYVYAAGKESGLVTFDISNTLNPSPVSSLMPTFFGGLMPTGVAQDGNYLFVSLGNFQGSGQTAGLAILDVTNPASPTLLDQWDSTYFNKGSAQVIREGDYAYLAAMDSGVVILDVSDPQNIYYVSHIVPDPNFGPQGYTYHSRGLFLSGDTLLVAHDNGGLRVVDVANKNAPVEIGMFTSPTIPAFGNSNSVFYNHVYRIGNYAYCAIDYMGWEVVDVSDPATMTEVAWVNNFACDSAADWFDSPGHTNEIAMASSPDFMVMSGAATEIVAIDPSDPQQPRLMGWYGTPSDNNFATWGVDVYGNMAVVAIVHNFFNWPYISTEGGIRLLNWSYLLDAETEEFRAGTLNMYPNPTSGSCTIELPATREGVYTIEVIDVLGKVVRTQPADSRMNGGKAEADLSGLASGIYTVRVMGENVVYTARVVRE